MDIYRALGLSMAAMLIPIIILIVYKVVPRFRRTNPKGWYVAVSIIAALSILVSLSPPVDKAAAVVVCGAILMFGFVRDSKSFRSREIREGASAKSE